MAENIEVYAQEENVAVDVGTGYAVFSDHPDWGSVTGKPSTFPPSSHTHALSDGVDAAKLNGKPPSYYLPVQNLFINPDFAIAQAGYNAMHGAIKYAADCWINENNLSVVEADSGINVTLTNSSAEIAQYIPKHVAKSVVGQPVTIALLLGNGVVCVANGIVPEEGSYSSFIYSVDNNILLKATYLPEGTIRAGFASGDDVGRDVNVRYVRFLPGTYTAENLPPYVPRPYAVELAECKRRFQIIGGENSYGYIGTAVAVSATQLRMGIQIPVEMAEAPDVHAYGNLLAVNSAFVPITDVIFNVSDTTSAMVYLNAAGGLTPGEAYIIMANNDGTARIELDSDL